MNKQIEIIKKNIRENLHLNRDFQIDNYNFVRDANLTENDLLILSCLLDDFMQWYETEYEEDYADEWADGLNDLYYFIQYIDLKADGIDVFKD